jgi:hypothetical protein
MLLIPDFLLCQLLLDLLDLIQALLVQLLTVIIVNDQLLLSDINGAPELKTAGVFALSLKRLLISHISFDDWQSLRGSGH